MLALPFLLSLLLAALLLGPLLRGLRERGATARNYRGAELPRPTGVLVVGSALPVVIGWSVLDRLTGLSVLPRGVMPVAIYVLGVAFLGVLDDLVSRSGAGPRGVRGHLATLAGRPSTGMVKAAGTLALAASAVLAPGSPLARGGGDGTTSGLGGALVAIALLTLAPHVFNLLDVRPGRSIKGLLLVGATLVVATRDLVPAGTLGPFLAPLLVLLPVDLRERGMLGDTGASAVGAVTGAWLVLALPPLAQALALAVAALVAAYGELRSITALVERRPVLRQLDSLGRCG